MINKIKKLYNSLSVQTKAAFWFMFCSMFPQVITVLSTTVFTRILSTADYGITSNYFAWYSIVSIFLTLSLNAGVYNNAMMRFSDRRDEYDASMMGLSLVLGGIGFLTLILLAPYLERITSLSLSLLLCLGLQCLFYNPYGCMISRARYEYNYRKVVGITIFTSVASPLLSLLFIFVFPEKAEGKVWGHNLCCMLIGAILYLRTFHRRLPLFNKKFWRYALLFNIPLIPHYLSMILLNQSDKIMITQMVGESANGLYSIAYSAASLLLIFNSGITQAFTPWVYETCKKGKVSEIRKYSRQLYMIFAGIIVLFVLFAPEAILILAGEKYREAVYAIPPIAAGMYFVFMYGMLSTLEFYHEHTMPVMVCSMVAAGANIALNYIFIPRYGYIASAYTTLICYAISGVMHIWVVRKIYRKEYPNEGDFFSTGFSLLAGFVLSAVAIAVSLLYKWPVVRWSMLLGAMAMVIYKRDYFIRLFRKEL